MTAVAIVVHSASGRTRALADAVAKGAAGLDGVVARVFDVVATSSGLPPGVHDALASADAIVFGCPTYMGSVSAAFKTFMDGTAAVWGLQGWRDKLAAGFTHSAAPSGDKLATLNQLAIFAAQHGMVWIPLGLPPTYAATGSADGDLNRLGSHLGAMAQSAPGTGHVPDSDLRTAEHLGRRVGEAAKRWAFGAPARPAPSTTRHRTTNYWAFPPTDRPAPPAGIDRINLRELIARGDRMEHHLVVCGTVGDVQLEVVTASEPLYFGHVNLSDEIALALPCGDDLVDRFPLFRTFLSDPITGADVGRYNHRVGDTVLHPEGVLHWPGRLRAPYEPFEVPAGMRRVGLSLVFCANRRIPSSDRAVTAPADRIADVKPYATPPPPMRLHPIGGSATTIATIGTARLELVVNPTEIAAPRGAWIVILEGAAPHFACDLLRVSPGTALDATGIVRALVLVDDNTPDPPPPAWRAFPALPIPPLEDVPRGALPFTHGALTIAEASDKLAAVSIDDTATEVPRYWLARMLYRCALHGLRLGYVETYGGFFVDDHAPDDAAVELGIRLPTGKASVTIPRAEALAVVERLYRAVAPTVGYRERLD